jgi:hypothetical protein
MALRYAFANSQQEIVDALASLLFVYRNQLDLYGGLRWDLRRLPGRPVLTLFPIIYR